MPDVSYEASANTLTVAGTALDLSEPTVAALARELVGLLSASFDAKVRRALALGHPSGTHPCRVLDTPNCRVRGDQPAGAQGAVRCRKRRVPSGHQASC